MAAGLDRIMHVCISFSPFAICNVSLYPVTCLEGFASSLSWLRAKREGLSDSTLHLQNMLHLSCPFLQYWELRCSSQPMSHKRLLYSHAPHCIARASTLKLLPIAASYKVF